MRDLCERPLLFVSLENDGYNLVSDLRKNRGERKVFNRVNDNVGR